MTWHKVAQVEEIQQGKPKIVLVKGKEVGIFYENGRYFAVLNFCPHFGAPVCLGKVFGAVTADEPGKLSYDASRLVLRCPWHRWEFDLETGVALTPIRQRLKTYSVQIDEQETVSECGQEPTNVRSHEGENAVTTYEVRLEEATILIEM